MGNLSLTITLNLGELTGVVSKAIIAMKWMGLYQKEEILGGSEIIREIFRPYLEQQ